MEKGYRQQLPDRDPQETEEWIESIAAIIEPTASKVASLLPGETTVSPSKNTKPFSGKAFSTVSR